MNEIETDSPIEGSPRTDKIKPRTAPSDTPHRTPGKARTARSRRPSIGLALVALGVVYGDIGTSPLYVMKAIVNGNGGIESLSQQTVIGALSLIIWTVTLITTVKYVLIALNADNKGEGGIFALYSLVRKHYPQLVGLAIVGGAALLADGILTPAVTITTAVEGLRTVEPIAAFFEGGHLRHRQRVRDRHELLVRLPGHRWGYPARRVPLGARGRQPRPCDRVSLLV